MSDASGTLEAPIDASGPLAADDAAPRKSGARNRRRLRRWLLWTALVRNVLASLKDAGLIAAFIALVFFSEQVLDALEDLGASIGPTRAGEAEFDKALKRLHRAADAMPADPKNAGSLTKKASRKLALAETRIADSEEGGDVDDWAVMLQGGDTPEEALALKDAAHAATSLPAVIYLRKHHRIVLPIARAEETAPVLAQVRAHYPNARLVRLSAWCKAPRTVEPITVCK